MIKVGCGTVLFREYELERSLDAIRNIGFEYFETQAGDNFYRFDLVMGGRDIEVDVNTNGEVTPARYGYF
jgi:sugar phosphate isomerase/epimerase